MIKIVEGNLLNATEDIIGHQVNCMGVMGSGVAKALREKYSDLYPEYQRYCRQVVNNLDLLGCCQITKVQNRYVANLFGQLSYGRGRTRYTRYKSLRAALSKLKEFGRKSGYSIALPYNIGCGLANGDWEVVYKMIDEVFEDYKVTLYKLN